MNLGSPDSTSVADVRRYLREFGFHIYEYKPFPQDAPVDLAATRADARPAPVTRAAQRMAQRRSAQRGSGRRAPLQRENCASRYFGRGANEPSPRRSPRPRSRAA